MREQRVVSLKIDEWRAETNGIDQRTRHNRNDSLERERPQKHHVTRQNSKIGTVVLM
jgi:hypothetical protein